MKSVSIIVPVYNVKNYLSKCIDSIISQTYTNIEVILVDDGSTDGSGNICDLYASKDKRIKAVHITNSGPSAARNCGIRAAMGDYILFVDGDDYISSTLVSETLKKAIENDADIVMFDADYVDELGKHIGFEYAFPGVIDPNLLVTPGILLVLPSLWNKLYKKELFIENNIYLPENISIGEDLTANMQLLSSAQKVVYINKFLYYYVRHNNSIMSNSCEDATKALKNRDILIAFEIINNYFLSNGKYDLYRDELNYLTVYYVFSAVVRINKCGAAKDLQSEMVDYVFKHCSRCKDNKYYNLLLSKKEKIIFFFIRHKLFRTLHFVLRLNSKLQGR